MKNLVIATIIFGTSLANATSIKMEDFHSYSPDIIKTMTKQGLTEQDLWSNQEFFSRDWVLHHKPISEFDQGVQNGFWSNMHQNPTIAKMVELDYSQVGELKVKLESKLKSNNIITLAFRSDSSDAKGRGYYTFEIPLDFEGEKEFPFKLKDAKIINQVGPWGKISGIYLFAKANGHRPNPYAALKLIDIETVAGVPETPKQVTTELYKPLLADLPTPNLNHAWDENQSDGAVVNDKKFITYQHHGRNEYDLFSYYPRYNAGYVSFSPSGRAYIAAGDLLQWLDDDSNWQIKSLKPHLMEWAKSKNYVGLSHNWGTYGSESTIRFDQQGNSYFIIQVDPFISENKRGSWKNRATLLFFSPDNFKTIKVYELPYRIGSFEKIDGNNPAALERPPVIMLSDYSYFPDSEAGLYYVQPQVINGELIISKPIQVSPIAIGCNYHSGDGNIVLSSNDKIFVIWGWVLENNHNLAKNAIETLKEEFPNEKDISKLWTIENLQKTNLATTLPAMPSTNAPERNMKFSYLWHYPFHSRFIATNNQNGVPTFISTFDRNSGKKLNTVYIGSAGHAIDGHNWGAISFTPEGFLEVIINGHHNPTLYTRSLEPYSATAFEPLKFIQNGQHEEYNSYGSLNSDTKGNLYSFHRSISGTCNNRLVMYRKKANQDWESPKTIAAPSKLLYYAWSHKVAINPINNYLYLSYQGKPGQSFWPPDYYETMLFTYPELEKTLSSRNRDIERLKVRQVRFWESWEIGDIVNLPSGEGVILVSKDGGDSWNLAKTEDFR